MTDVFHGTQVDTGTWKCRVCGMPLMAIPSGSTCAKGCIGILPKMPSAVRRINHAILNGIHRIENRMGKYYLDDGTRVTRGKQINREVRHEEIERQEVALEGTKIYQVRRDHADGEQVS